MAREVWIRKVQGKAITGFVPAERADQVEIDALPYGRDLRAMVTVPRSVPYHRQAMKAFSLIANVLNAGPTDKQWDQNRVRRRLLTHLGYADVEWLPAHVADHYADIPKGVKVVELVPRSMAFENMDQDEIVRFFDAAMIYVIGEFGEWVKGHPDWQAILGIAQKLNLLPYGETA